MSLIVRPKHRIEVPTEADSVSSLLHVKDALARMQPGQRIAKGLSEN